MTGIAKTSGKGAGRDAATRRTCCLARGRGASRSRVVRDTQLGQNPQPSTQRSGALPEWQPRNCVCWPEGIRQARENAACVDAPLGFACQAKEHGQGTRPREYGGSSMTSFRLRILAQTLPFLLIAPLALAQTPASKAPSRAQATAALNQPANPGAAHYTRQQIDQIVAPIALYPDQLLSQVLMAATYPQQIAEAAQWLRDD